MFEPSRYTPELTASATSRNTTETLDGAPDVTATDLARGPEYAAYIASLCRQAGLQSAATDRTKRRRDRRRRAAAKAAETTAQAVQAAR